MFNLIKALTKLNLINSYKVNINNNKLTRISNQIKQIYKYNNKI
jgi:hypothetical protein